MIIAGETIFDGMATAKKIVLYLEIKSIAPSQMMDICNIIMQEYMVAQAYHDSIIADKEQEIAKLKFKMLMLERGKE